MMMNYKKKTFICILVLISALMVFIQDLKAEPSSLLGPTGLINTPSAYTGSGFGYYSSGGSTFYKLNYALFSKAIETGMLYDKTGGTRSYNLKLPLISESGYMPQVALGAYNYKSQAVGQTNYIVLSKYVDSLGLTLHMGYMNNGGLKDASKLVNYKTIQDAIDDVKNKSGKTFIGLEYSFFPMFAIIGEYQNEAINGGLRFKPLPVLTLDYDIIDLKNVKNLEKKRILNFNFSFGF